MNRILAKLYRDAKPEVDIKAMAKKVCDNNKDKFIKFLTDNFELEDIIKVFGENISFEDILSSKAADIIYSIIQHWDDDVIEVEDEFGVTDYLDELGRNYDLYLDEYYNPLMEELIYLYYKVANEFVKTL